MSTTVSAAGIVFIVSRARTIGPVWYAWPDARPAARCDSERAMRKMLTPHVRAIGRPAGPGHDAPVPPAPRGGRSGASPCRYLPQVVVPPRTVGDVRAILAY